MARKSNKILVLDTETGGLDPSNASLLTVGMIAADYGTGKVHDQLYLEIKHDIYEVAAGALRVNKIKDLVKHDKSAVSCKDAVGQIVDFLEKNFKKSVPVAPFGQNINFDIGFMKQLFKKANADYNDFFSYQYLDTMPILRFLAMLDVIPQSAVKLDGARKHFNIKTKRGAAHNALDDCEATLALIRALADLFIGGGEDIEEEAEEEKSAKKKAKKSKKKSSPGEKKGKKKKKEEEPEEEEDELVLDDEEEDEDEDEDTPEELEEEDEDEEEEDEDEEDEDDDEDEDEDELDDWDDEEEDEG